MDFIYDSIGGFRIGPLLQLAFGDVLAQYPGRPVAFSVRSSKLHYTSAMKVVLHHVLVKFNVLCGQPAAASAEPAAETSLHGRSRLKDSKN